jgi:hypothetical protein
MPVINADMTLRADLCRAIRRARQTIMQKKRKTAIKSKFGSKHSRMSRDTRARAQLRRVHDNSTPVTCFWQRGSTAALAPSFDIERIAERSETGSPAGAWAKH